MGDGLVYSNKVTGEKKVTGINALFDIIKVEGDGFRKGSARRKILLKEWIEKYLVTTEMEMSILNRRYLTSDNQDKLIYTVSTQLAEKMIEEGLIQVTREDLSLIHI